MTIFKLDNKIPKIHPTAFLTEGCFVIGDVTIGAESSIWYGAVVRGDIDRITIGERTNIQDNCTCHVTGGVYPLTIGNDVTVGHAATLHGCTIDDRVLIGMGAIVLDNSRIHSDTLVGAGALVLEGAEIPSGELWAGVPAHRIRNLTETEIRQIGESAERYVGYSRVAREQLKVIAREEAATGI